MATVLVLEAADQGAFGMQAILHVINNRSGGEVDRIPAVIARHKAFTCLNDITRQTHPDYGPAIGKAMEDKMWPLAVGMVDQFLAGRLGPDPTAGATHYCVHPPDSWLRQMTYITQIGAHHFFIE